VVEDAAVQGQRAADGQRPLRFGLAGTGYWAALTELADNARSGRVTHACDVRFGRDVGRVLADAQRQLDARHG
jgi:hypothetical protein